MARSSDNPDRTFTKGDPTFEGRIAASSGLIPNFMGITESVRQKLGNAKNAVGRFVAGDAAKEYPNLKFNLNGTLDGKYAYVLPNGTVFKPNPGQKIDGKADSQYIVGRSMVSPRSSPKDTRARISLKKCNDSF